MLGDVVMVSSEKLVLDNKSLSELFNKDFMQKISALGKNIFPVNVLFICDIDDDGKKTAIPIMINHNSKVEVENKTLHIECADPKLLELISKIIENN